MESLDEARLTAMEIRLERARTAVPTPWIEFLETRQGLGGASFIRFGPEEVDGEIYASIFTGGRELHSPDSNLDAFLDFVAYAIEDMPALLAEVRRLRAERDASRT